MNHPIHQGFILTAFAHDDNDRMLLEIWVKTPDGPQQLIFDQQQPCFFIAEHDLIRAQLATRQRADCLEFKPVSLKTFSQEPVVCCYANTLNNFYEARKNLTDKKVIRYEDDIQMADRFFMERFIYGSLDFAETGQPQQKEGFIHHINPKTKPGDYRPALTSLSLDIECDVKGNLFSVGLYSSDGDSEYEKVIMIGDEQQGHDWIEWVPDEPALLHVMVECINEFDPDLIIGWNVIGFDFRLLAKRAELNDVPLAIGRDGSTAQWRESRADNQLGFIDIAGRKVLDGIHGLKSATFSFRSFSLENVAQELLGIGKKIENPHDRLAQIVHDFHHNKVKLAEYNLQDCRLVDQIFRKTRLLDFLMFRYQLTGLPLDKQGGSVAAFTNLYLPKLHRAGYVAPNLPENGGLASPGGYVMDSLPGLYQDVLVLDFKSLYPSIIRTFKIDPMGLIEGLREPVNAIEGFLGGKFSRDKHFLPGLVERLWEERDHAKADNDKERSQAIKIFMSSFYGVLGSGGCRFYDRRLSSSITLRGHEIMQTTAKWIEAEGYQVIYGDTDSTFVWIGENQHEQASEIGERLASMINQRWKDKIKSDHALQSHLEIEFESHYQRFFMPTIRNSEQGSKKRYAGLTENKDGTTNIVFKGLENARTDWTDLAREFQADLYQEVFEDKDPSELIANYVQETLAGNNDEKLVYHKRLRRPAIEYQKNIPPHVKAALYGDAKNQSLGRPLQYNQKTQIDYMMTLNGPQAIEYQESAPDYAHYIDKQLKPIADAILPVIGLNFDTITSDQLRLF